MKNIITGLLALPVIAIAIFLIILIVGLLFSGAAVVIGLVATFGPPILAGVAAIGIVLGIIYGIGSVIRNSLSKNGNNKNNK